MSLVAEKCRNITFYYIATFFLQLDYGDAGSGNLWRQIELFRYIPHTWRRGAAWPSRLNLGIRIVIITEARRNKIPPRTYFWQFPSGVIFFAHSFALPPSLPHVQLCRKKRGLGSVTRALARARDSRSLAHI